MQQSHKRGFAFLAAATAVALLLGYATRKQQLQRQQQQTHAYGCLTPAQVTSRAQALCRILTPQTGKVELTLERYTIHPIRGGPVREWHVDCRNEADEHIAFLIWNAESGTLVQVSLPTVLDSDTPPQIDSRQAERRGWGWLRLLGMVSEREAWRLLEATQSRSTVWRGHCAGPGREVAVLVDMRTGNLMQAQCWRSAADRPTLREPFSDF